LKIASVIKCKQYREIKTGSGKSIAADRFWKHSLFFQLILAMLTYFCYLTLGGHQILLSAIVLIKINLTEKADDCHSIIHNCLGKN